MTTDAIDSIDTLVTRVRREIDEGILPSAQIALARDGEVFYTETFGDATDDSLYCIFSATKAITSAAAWLVIQDGQLDVSERVADIVEEFGANGKEAVTVEQLFTHMAGFPSAPFRVTDWDDRARRLERFAAWRLNWEPGTRFEYHPTASMWVIAEIIERKTGIEFRQFVRERVTQPLDLPDLFVGMPAEQYGRLAHVSPCGDPLTPEEYKKMGIPAPPETEVTEAALLNFNKPESLAVGVPGGGGVTNAPSLALFYQALLAGGRNGTRLWSDETLAMARQVRSGELRDPMFKKLANRGLGIIVAGGDDRSFRGFGKTNSAETFGHNGAGGQLAWVDPATGLSLAYLTNGHDRNEIRQGRRGVAISSLAANC